MHAESSNGDEPFAKMKILIKEMISRLEGMATAVAPHKASPRFYVLTLGMAIVTLFFTLLKFLSPAHRGGFLQQSSWSSRS